MKSNDIYYGRYENGKFFVPCCSVCLEPFEKYDEVVTHTDIDKPWMELDLIHSRCEDPQIIIYFSKNHQKYLREYE